MDDGIDHVRDHVARVVYIPEAHVARPRCSARILWERHAENRLSVCNTLACAIRGLCPFRLCDRAMPPLLCQSYLLPLRVPAEEEQRDGGTHRNKGVLEP